MIQVQSQFLSLPATYSGDMQSEVSDGHSHAVLPSGENCTDLHVKAARFHSGLVVHALGEWIVMTANKDTTKGIQPIKLLKPDV